MSAPVRSCGTRVLALLAVSLASSVSASAQITISGSDLFTRIGQFYEAYVSKDVNVSGLLGTPGATAQAWDFTEGSTNLVYRFDYLPVGASPDGTAFPDATYAERLTDQSTGTEKWMFLHHAPGEGRRNYGFHDPEFSSSQPTAIFEPPITDFPDRIGFGDTWKAATEFMSEISFGIPGDDEDGGGDFAIPTRVTYNSAAKVDAFGLVNHPRLGFGECLRVNELSEYDIAVDFGLGDGFMSVATQYVRTYYWLRRGHGIVVQVTSRQLDTPPPDDFAVAAAVVRMYATNHEEPVVDVPAIHGFKITLGKEGALLQWTKAAGLARYRIEQAPAAAGPWTLLGETASNFHLDAAANKPGVPTRFYRLSGFN